MVNQEGKEVGSDFFFFKQKTAYEMLRSLVGSEMCIRDSKEELMYEMEPIQSSDSQKLDTILSIVNSNSIPPTNKSGTTKKGTDNNNVSSLSSSSLEEILATVEGVLVEHRKMATTDMTSIIVQTVSQELSKFTTPPSLSLIHI
eukprot:TRINITY_DN24699_c0_g1_i1.p1 TRINITY_DN24699_c0_g1~~TRINITY_DN24699_c0_g1_i1.p1  ORF type:complete len:144 (-),score=52.63 TRINITY_DN24699_c0_g1_i1:98-529(-)